MRAVQGETRLLMLEQALLEILLIVTVQALTALKTRAEIGLMLILVAAKALLGSQLRPAVLDIVLTLGYVTFLTTLLSMNSHQCITGLARMVEFLHILPCFGYVTRCAVFALELRRLKEMDIVLCMATHAGRALLAEELRLVLAG
jgi:hypothetical protein